MIVLVKLFSKKIISKTQLLLGFLFLYVGCDHKNKVNTITGETMGTTYSIKIVSQNKLIENSEIKISVDSVLAIINMQMSTWIPDSEISQFNSRKLIGPFSVSESFFNVVKVALEISDITDQYFDVTVFDLMMLWGFGPNPKLGFPSDEDIQKVLKYSGSKNISAKNGLLIKNNPSTKLDLNSIAKGYAVDEVFHFLRSKGYRNLFIEIGGEVRCLGRNRVNKVWSLGVENPIIRDVEDKKLAFIIYIDDGSIATSGNYRSYIKSNNKIIGHTLNPITGYPVKTNVKSVTVKANSCMLADGWATALMAMNYKLGLEMVLENPEIEAAWILAEEDGEIKIACSDGFDIKSAIYKIIR